MLEIIVVVVKPLVFLTYSCRFLMLLWYHIIGSRHNANYPENLALFYKFQWVFPTEYPKKYKNPNKEKSLNSEYLKSLLYWCERELISKLWKPKNTLIYRHALCTGISIDQSVYHSLESITYKGWSVTPSWRWSKVPGRCEHGFLANKDNLYWLGMVSHKTNHWLCCILYKAAGHA